MSYSYWQERAKLFTEEGQVLFLRIRDHVQRLLAKAGAVREQEATSVGSGDSWTLIACMDRLVELGEIREVTNSNTCGQHRVFVKNRAE